MKSKKMDCRTYSTSVHCKMHEPVTDSDQKTFIFWNSVFDSYIEFEDYSNQKAYKKCKNILMCAWLNNVKAIHVKNEMIAGNFNNAIVLTFKFESLKDLMNFNKSIGSIELSKKVV